MTDAPTARSPEGDRRAWRVLLLIDHGENRRLLAEWLAENDYEVVEPPLEADDLTEVGFDLCVLDRRTLEDNVDRLTACKRTAEPTFLPYLLTVSGRRRDDLDPDVWEQIDAIVQRSVDEVIRAPIRKTELRARLENLLSTRALSLQLKERNEQLEALNRVNSVIRGINKVLVGASSREEIEQAVCDRLVDSDAYTCAWTGDLQATSREVEPRAQAGVDGATLSAHSLEHDLEDGEGGLVARTVSDRRVHLLRVGDEAVPGDDPAVVPADGVAPPWLPEAVQSVAAVPLVYGQTIYGVLVVCAARPGAFDAEEREVLAELGELIGHAINAAESKRALLTDRATELEFQVGTADDFVFEASQRTGATLSLEGVAAQSEGPFLQYFTVDDADPAAVLEIAEGHEAVERVRRVDDHETESLFELAFDGPSVVMALADHGATVEEFVVEDGRGRVVAEFPQGTDLRAIVEAFQATYPAAELVAQREVERSFQTAREFRNEILEERLTDRQRSALQTAYLAGFFDWPRESSGQDVADALSVAPSTFHQHLRASERKLFAAIFDGDPAE